MRRGFRRYYLSGVLFACQPRFQVSRCKPYHSRTYREEKEHSSEGE